LKPAPSASQIASKKPAGSRRLSSWYASNDCELLTRNFSGDKDFVHIVESNGVYHNQPVQERFYQNAENNWMNNLDVQEMRTLQLQRQFLKTLARDLSVLQ
jgi:hypothetical protein